ncbi:MAG: hypothetical protein GDA38_25120 [Hormoscilla sp. SP12CHS1]|nr:hypothetical protein [Hormoscilla sp. SP12CHS1]
MDPKWAPLSNHKGSGCLQYQVAVGQMQPMRSPSGYTTRLRMRDPTF